MQIINGRGNPLARAAARGDAGDETSMQQAAAYDLDILQRLAVTETTLSGMSSGVDKIRTCPAEKQATG